MGAHNGVRSAIDRQNSSSAYGNGNLRNDSWKHVLPFITDPRHLRKGIQQLDEPVTPPRLQVEQHRAVKYHNA